VAQVQAGLYASCGLCAVYCQFGAISLNDGYATVDTATCMGCGVCVAHCPEEAVSLLRDPAKGAPLEIQKRIAEAATFLSRPKTKGMCSLVQQHSERQSLYLLQ
jgi:ferredoxin